MCYHSRTHRLRVIVCHVKRPTNTNSVDRAAVNQPEDAYEDTFATTVSKDTATPTLSKDRANSTALKDSITPTVEARPLRRSECQSHAPADRLKPWTFESRGRMM